MIDLKSLLMKILGSTRRTRRSSLERQELQVRAQFLNQEGVNSKKTQLTSIKLTNTTKVTLNSFLDRR